MTTRLTARADAEEFGAIESTTSVEWCVAAETPLPIKAWDVIGPFNYQSFGARYLPETSTPPEKSWNALYPDANGFLDLKSAYESYRNSVVYARSRIFIPRAAQLSISIGASGPLKVWVNNTPLIARDDSQTPDPLTDTAITMLKPGWNTLLVRETRGPQGWGFITKTYLSGLQADELAKVKFAPAE